MFARSGYYGSIFENFFFHMNSEGMKRQFQKTVLEMCCILGTTSLKTEFGNRAACNEFVILALNNNYYVFFAKYDTLPSSK